MRTDTPLRLALRNVVVTLLLCLFAGGFSLYLFNPFPGEWMAGLLLGSGALCLLVGILSWLVRSLADLKLQIAALHSDMERLREKISSR